MAEKQENVLQSLEENIKLVTKQIKDGECKRDCSSAFNTFIKDEYWTRMSVIFKLLSAETTKISLAFSKKPFPSYKNTEQMVVQLEKAMLTLVSAFYSLPHNQGAALHGHLKRAVLQVLASLTSFTSAVAECLCSEKPTERLQWTGGVWEATDFVLLTDNKECARRELRDTLSMVMDALDEIDEAKENEGEMNDFLSTEEDLNSSTWSDQDKVVVEACTGMVKTTKMVMKKSLECLAKHGEVDTEEGVRLLDEAVSLTKGASSKVDDFVCGIYAPINYTPFFNNGKALFEFTDSILKFLRDSKLTCQEDTKVLDFLCKANSHNFGKLETSVMPRDEDG